LKKTNPNSSSKASNFDREQYLYLTTRGRKSGLPREIEIWFTHREGRFYLIAEYPTSKWVQNLRADPKAQVRITGEKFAAHATFHRPPSRPRVAPCHQRSIQQEIRLGRRDSGRVSSRGLGAGVLKGHGFSARSNTPIKGHGFTACLNTPIKGRDFTACLKSPILGWAQRFSAAITALE
jgi:deazaflavin-dependent oxidoreductase (nitroreductase family)